MAESMNPLKQILNIRRSEVPLAALMFGYFFLVITTFWILKPLKKGMFIGFYDVDGFNLMSWQMNAAQAELLAKVLNMFVAFAAVTVFTLVVRSFRRQQLTYVFSAFFIVCYALYSFVLDDGGGLAVWSFYLFGDLYSTLMVATFFAFLNDSVRSDVAKRLYGLIGLGGVTGGWVGTEVLKSKIEEYTYAEWLWVCLGIAIVIAVIAFLVGRLIDEPVSLDTSSLDTAQTESEPTRDGSEAKREKGNAALEGARLVFASPYLLSIVAIVGLYEMVSTIMDFQFSSTISHYLDGPAIGAQFASVFNFTNRVAFFVQLFLTSFVMTRFGVGVALMFLPVAALIGSGAFLVAPVLLVGSALNTADNGFSYSINQSAKEVLYVPTSADEKYKAKAFIDMFVQRFAKALAVGVSLVITTYFAGFESIRWLSIVTVLILVVWIAAVRYAGRKFNELESEA